MTAGLPGEATTLAFAIAAPDMSSTGGWDFTYHTPDDVDDAQSLIDEIVGHPRFDSHTPGGISVTGPLGTHSEDIGDGVSWEDVDVEWLAAQVDADRALQLAHDYTVRAERAEKVVGFRYTRHVTELFRSAAHLQDVAARAVAS